MMIQVKLITAFILGVLIESIRMYTEDSDNDPMKNEWILGCAAASICLFLKLYSVGLFAALIEITVYQVVSLVFPDMALAIMVIYNVYVVIFTGAFLKENKEEIEKKLRR